tara:strand:+ start:938 stop:1855 length:918 start_codon:yes stop_codon:yes gene_type:complete
MNIHLHNIDLTSSSGPNCFGRKLFDYLRSNGLTFDASQVADLALVFIETGVKHITAPIIQRLDGIYFNSEQNYLAQNKQILDTYRRSSGVVFQSEFNKELTTKYFGEHKNSAIIHNGANLDLIKSLPNIEASIFSNYKNVWCCASSWRPHKRLEENIRYFLEHSGADDVLLVAGYTGHALKKPIEDKKIKYLGNLDYISLLNIYKCCDYFIHLAWLDHCPNVVVDARACGCRIICSSAGGTKEIAGPDAIIIDEEDWDFEPVKLYSPPALNFEQTSKNLHNSNYDMGYVGKKYLDFMKENTNEYQ